MRLVNFFRKNPRLARDIAILVIFHKKGLKTPRFSPWVSGNMGGLGQRIFFPKKIPIILGTVKNLPEDFSQVGSSVTKKINGHLGGPHNDPRPPGGGGASAPSAPMNLLLQASLLL